MTRSQEAETVEIEDDESRESARTKRVPARREDATDWKQRARQLEDRLTKLEREHETLRSALSSHAESPFIRSAARGKSVVARTVKGRPRDQQTTPSRGIDTEARRELADAQLDRRQFLRKSAIGAGVLALGAGLGYSGGFAQGAGLAGGVRTVISDTEIAARVIGGVRIATEFIPDQVPAGTDLDPYPGSAIQAALNDGLAVYIPSGTWRLSSTISRPVDNATLIGAGRSTKLLLDGATPCISAGTQSGWLMANLATDAGGVDIDSASETRRTEIWVDGVLTDNRPIAGGGGGGGGFYGARAEDFITQGDGSPTNPYNASAVQSAIDALSSRGGIVFVKAGYYEGNTRIRVNPPKWVTIVGEGVPALFYGDDDGQRMLRNTHIRAGFDCYNPTSFHDITISPRPGFEATEPALKIILDPVVNPDLHKWTGGFEIKNVRIQFGHPGIHMTGVNMPSWSDNWQIWHILMERVLFIECGTGLRIDPGDSTVQPQLSSCVFRNLEFRWCNTVANAYTIDIGRLGATGSMSWDGEMSDVLVEGCAQTGMDYTIYINAWANGKLRLANFDFGDGSFANKDAYLSLNARGGFVEGFVTSKGMTIGGSGYYRVGRQWWGSGNFDITGSDLFIEPIPGLALPIGTIDNPSSVYISQDVVVGANTLRVLRRQA